MFAVAVYILTCTCFSVGDRITVEWKFYEDSPFNATVVEVEDDDVHVRYDDGDEEKFDPLHPPKPWRWLLPGLDDEADIRPSTGSSDEE